MSPKISHRASTEAQHQLTELDEKRKMASEILKRVDQLIKAKDLQKALLETTHAKQIDPKNVYAFALEERIQVLLAEQIKTLQQKDQIKSQPKIDTKVCQEWHHGTSTVLPTPVLQNTNQITGNVATVGPQCQQKVSPKSITNPSELRQQPVSTPVPDTMKIRVSNQIKRSPKVLIIDDDSSLLSVLSMSIESGGFEVIPLSTSDEAYVLLKKFTPDIILCDVNLETSTMGGFTFFEKIQAIEHLKQVPFLFLTGLSDDVLIRTGKEMGVDDYLTKPIKEQNLLAALRGKLKRFEQLKRS